MPFDFAAFYDWLTQQTLPEQVLFALRSAPVVVQYCYWFDDNRPSMPEAYPEAFKEMTQEMEAGQWVPSAFACRFLPLGGLDGKWCYPANAVPLAHVILSVLDQALKEIEQEQALYAHLEKVWPHDHETATVELSYLGEFVAHGRSWSALRRKSIELGFMSGDGSSELMPRNSSDCSTALRELLAPLVPVLEYHIPLAEQAAFIERLGGMLVGFQDGAEIPENDPEKMRLAIEGAVYAVLDAVKEQLGADAKGEKRNKLPDLGPHDMKALMVLQSTGKTQEEIAELLNEEYGTNYKQYSICRMLDRATKHANASGLSKHFPKPASREKPVDPSRLDLGQRTDPRPARRKSHDDS